MIDKQWIVGETCPLKRLLNATPFARVFIKYNMYSLCSGHIKAFLQCTLSLYLNDVSKKHVRGRRFPKSFLAVVLVPSWFSISLLRCWSGNRVWAALLQTTASPVHTGSIGLTAQGGGLVICGGTVDYSWFLMLLFGLPAKKGKSLIRNRKEVAIELFTNKTNLAAAEVVSL